MTATATTAPPVGRAPAPRKGSAAPVAAAPRVSLMPPELGMRNKALGVQRGLRLLMFGVAALVVLAIGAAWYYSFSAAVALDIETSRTEDLQAEKLEYAEVQRAIDEVEVGAAALMVGGSTEIDWLDYLAKVQASLPPGVTLDVFKIETAAIGSLYPQSEIPLEGPRIATLEFTAISPGLPEVPVWLDGLETLPGYVDAVPGSVQLLNEGGYTVNITMHVDSGAYSNRIVKIAEKATQIGKPAADDEEDSE